MALPAYRLPSSVIANDNVRPTDFSNGLRHLVGTGLVIVTLPWFPLSTSATDIESVFKAIKRLYSYRGPHKRSNGRSS